MHTTVSAAADPVTVPSSDAAASQEKQSEPTTEPPTSAPEPITEKPTEAAKKQPITFPISYSDDGVDILITKQWYVGAWCYIAHIRLSDYARFKTGMANETYGSAESIFSYISRHDCLLAVNGDYAEGYGLGVIRDGIVCNDGPSTAKGLYSQRTGRFTGRRDLTFSQLARSGYTDTFEFTARELVVDGKSVYLRKDGGKSTQRTLIGTTGNCGEIYLVVTEGNYSDGVSRGLQYWEAGDLLESLGCTLGLALDGGGSSVMVWNGRLLNRLYTGRKLTNYIFITG